MSNRHVSFAKYIWVLGCTACLTLPVLVSPVNDSHALSFDAIEEMAFAMFVFSFPGSLIFSMVAAIFFLMFSPFDLPVATYLLLWFGFFVTGYVQWFWVVPELFQKRQLISLGLGRLDEIEASKCRRPKRVNPARIDHVPILHRDEEGRTPLERVIRDN
jgi:hypothetical protein